MKNIPIRLKQSREKAGISITKMAASVGTSRGHIYSLEQYTGHPPKIDLLDVADYASITQSSVAWLLLGIDPDQASLLINLRMSELTDVMERSAHTTHQEILRTVKTLLGNPLEK